MDLLLVAAGGALGAVARHLAQAALSSVSPAYPLGTLLVNIIGSFAAGLLWPLLDRLAPAVRPLVLVGLLGALTTMSSFVVECLSMAMAGRSATAVGYAVTTMAACLTVAAFGLWAGGRL